MSSSTSQGNLQPLLLGPRLSMSIMEAVVSVTTCLMEIMPPGHLRGGQLHPMAEAGAEGDPTAPHHGELGALAQEQPEPGHLGEGGGGAHPGTCWGQGHLSERWSTITARPFAPPWRANSNSLVISSLSPLKRCLSMQPSPASPPPDLYRASPSGYQS